MTDSKDVRVPDPIALPQEALGLVAGAAGPRIDPEG
jgi:hypothetical protein